MIHPKIRFNHHPDGEQIARSAGCVYNPIGDTTISRYDNDGDCMGGALFRDYTGRGGSTCVHFAGFHPRWICKDLLFVCFDYPFNQLGVKKMFAQVPMSNETSLKLCRHFGWKPEQVIEDVYPDGDMQLFSMYRADCRFLDIVPSFAKEAPDGR